MKDKASCISMLLLIVVVCFSCGEYEALEIEKESKRVADSLFRAHKDSLTKMSDTLCQVRHDELFKLYYDSIKKIEGDKIRELINK